MRSLPLLLASSVIFVTTSANAQVSTKATVLPKAKPQAASQPLTISALPNAPVQLELEGTERDILGMLKSFIKGLESANTQQSKSATANTLLQLLSDKQFSAALKNIHNLHVVVYNLDGLEGSDAIRSKVPDPIVFYDKPFRAEGGKRTLTADFKSTKVAMFGFNKVPGFALVVNSPSRVVVVRADGYPDMEVIGRMISFGSPTQPVQQNTAKPSAPKIQAPQKP